MQMEKRYYALIMAGGQGTRFWPWSSAEKPKQFLGIIGKEPLITQTFQRLAAFIPRENIFIVADGKYRAAVKEALPAFNDSRFIAEPLPRNTAPCLILANIVISAIDPGANLLVVPADHYIPDTDVFAAQFRDALALAEQRLIVTSGIRPTMPHTGYGYINFEAAGVSSQGQTTFYAVQEFKEKPGLAEAEAYLAAGNYYWNSGMFVYKLKYFRDFLAQYAPYYFEQYVALEAALADPRAFFDIFKQIEPDSIDYALMERVKEVKMFKAAFTWSDVGSWSSMFELNAKDENNNVAGEKNQIFIDSRDSLIFSTGKKAVAVIGLQEVAVIDTENGILVASLKEVQKVKQVLPALEKLK